MTTIKDLAEDYLISRIIQVHDKPNHVSVICINPNDEVLALARLVCPDDVELHLDEAITDGIDALTSCLWFAKKSVDTGGENARVADPQREE